MTMAHSIQQSPLADGIRSNGMVESGSEEESVDSCSICQETNTSLTMAFSDYIPFKLL